MSRLAGALLAGILVSGCAHQDAWQCQDIHGHWVSCAEIQCYDAAGRSIPCHEDQECH